MGIDKHPTELKAIRHENTNQTNILHKNGTISMARLEPGTASLEFLFVSMINRNWTMVENEIQMVNNLSRLDK